MFPFKKKEDGNILEIEKSDQYHTVDDLILKSHPNSKYYTLLVLSALIIGSGLLIENTAIVIGGMLVTPVLTPILLFSLGLVVLEFSAIYRAGLLTVISFLIILIISWLLAYFFGTGQQPTFLSSEPTKVFQLYVIVAFASGVAATFAWTRKEMTDVLPGVAMAVSLVPPISLVGLNLGSQNNTLVEFYIYVFVLNLLGILIGSFLVFTLLKFYRARAEVKKEIES